MPRRDQRGMCPGWASPMPAPFMLAAGGVAVCGGRPHLHTVRSGDAEIASALSDPAAHGDGARLPESTVNRHRYRLPRARSGPRRCAVSELMVSPVGEDDQARALDTLILAFAADPVERWLYPQPGSYLGSFRRFLIAFGGRAFDEQTAWKIGDCSAVALWLPPGAEPDGDSLVAVLTDSVAPDQHDVMFAVLRQMQEAHPTYPHWYLPWLGADPAVQGCSSRAWTPLTRAACRRISKPRTRAPSLSTSAWASRSPARLKPGTAPRSRAC
jgi:hypothetical protein